MEFIIYTCLAAGYSLFVAKKTDRFLLGFVILFWILAKPVVNSHFVINIPGIGFSLSPNRMLFIFCICYLALGATLRFPYQRTKNKSYKRPKFEKYLYLFGAPILLSIALNLNLIPVKSIIALPLELVTFITVYVTMKRYMTKSLLDAILKSIVVLSVFSSLLVILQLVVDQDFLRSGAPKIAFGHVYRSFGIFEYDGELGFFQALSLVVILVRYPQGLRRLMVMALILFSVFLTFHRLSYLVTYVSLATYALFYSRGKTSFRSTFIIVAIPVLLVISSVLYNMLGGGLDLVDQRIKKDTISGRFHQYIVTMESMATYPGGLANVDNPRYMAIMKKHGMIQWLRDKNNTPYLKPLEVHNGYFSVGIMHGVAGLLLLLCLFFSLFRYFNTLALADSRQFIIPLFGVYIWALSNTTQRNDSFRFYYVILLAILVGSFLAMYRTNHETKHQVKIKDMTT